MEEVQETNFPNYGYGRMFKTGREEIVSLYSALRQYLSLDGEAVRADAEGMEKGFDLGNVADRMRKGEPSVYIKPEGRFFYINPMTLTEAEMRPVVDKLKAVEREILMEVEEENGS